MTNNISTFILIKYLVNKDGELTTPQKLITGIKTLVLYLYVLFCLYVVQKATAHFDTKALNMCHQSQKGFQCIFIGITQHQKRYLIYVRSERKIVSSHDIVFDETFSSALA